MKMTVCVNGRFCWEKRDFSDWDDILPADDDFVLMPYNNWTAPMLIGDKKRYLELISKEEYLAKHSGSPCVWKDDEMFCFGLGFDCVIKRCEDIEDAVFAMLHSQGDHEPFVPDSVYVPGDGQLERLLNSSSSVLLILPFWNPALSLEENRNRLGKWYEFNRSRKVQKELRRKMISKLLRYKVKHIALRCGPFAPDEDFESRYTPADYRADGLCIELAPNTSSPVDIEAFQADYAMLAEAFGTPEIFCKEKDKCFILSYDGKTVKTPLEGTATDALFGFLQRVYSSGNDNNISVPFIEEELERADIVCCGSFAGAIAYYQTKSPVRRSQWHRILRPEFTPCGRE
ncbi:MAG: hypothetical protein E7045_06085 [Lentisphaerae bacterium]|nr:hypothetical protein [Lentisphaerota bacterium]